MRKDSLFYTHKLKFYYHLLIDFVFCRKACLFAKNLDKPGVPTHSNEPDIPSEKLVMCEAGLRKRIQNSAVCSMFFELLRSRNVFLN